MSVESEQWSEKPFSWEEKPFAIRKCLSIYGSWLMCLFSVESCYLSGAMDHKSQGWGGTHSVNLERWVTVWLSVVSGMRISSITNQAINTLQVSISQYWRFVLIRLNKKCKLKSVFSLWIPVWTKSIHLQLNATTVCGVLNSAHMHGGFIWLFIHKEATDGEDASRLLDAASVLLNFLSLTLLAGDLWPCGCVLICWRYYYINYLARGRSKPHQHPVSREACFVSTPRPQLRRAGSPDSITCITPVQQKHTVPNPRRSDIRNHAQS